LDAIIVADQHLMLAAIAAVAAMVWSGCHGSNNGMLLLAQLLADILKV
jgi:hypothetical protein